MDGPGDYAKGSARKLAEMGYLAFAADIYGKGVRPRARKRRERVGQVQEGPEVDAGQGPGRARSSRSNPLCDTKRVAAIGYCFGGTCVLELARSGADIAGVVSFHGGLDTPTPEDAKQIKCKVLVLHGGDDPHVP